MYREDLVIGNEYIVTGNTKLSHILSRGDLVTLKYDDGTYVPLFDVVGRNIDQFINIADLEPADPVEIARSNLKKAEEELKKAEAEAQEFKMSDLKFPLVVEIDYDNSLRVIVSRTGGGNSRYLFIDTKGNISNRSTDEASLLRTLNYMYKKTTRTFSVSN